jgi:hypothetical protein
VCWAAFRRYRASSGDPASSCCSSAKLLGLAENNPYSTTIGYVHSESLLGSCSWRNHCQQRVQQFATCTGEISYSSRNCSARIRFLTRNQCSGKRIFTYMMPFYSQSCADYLARNWASSRLGRLWIRAMKTTIHVLAHEKPWLSLYVCSGASPLSSLHSFMHYIAQESSDVIRSKHENQIELWLTKQVVQVRMQNITPALK